MQPLVIKINASETLRKLTKEFLVMPDRFEIAVDRAINRTLTALITEGNKIATERYTAVHKKPRSIARKFRSFKGRMTGVVDFTGRRGSSLRNFMPEPDANFFMQDKIPLREGVSSRILKGGVRKVYTDKAGNKPFWLPMKQGGYGLFYNARKNRAFKKWHGITLAYGPSGIQAILRKEGQERLRLLAESVLTKRMVSELTTVIRGYA